ncbi:glycosyltransferase family 39 protein [Terrihalobacillus insolitus]|uniref:glycosyltransferase family 39 protein n=1 Tax=Terrihalobacillus insolitus TaxID=2950438 RepID=UPI00233FEF9F|nr:glycosyltransferase family 39 protein [Terrihalobacillus insolitus]MDC3413204.1 glycosyltransferase family 39 protein [Terrihalobacillus insolitus]
MGSNVDHNREKVFVAILFIGLLVMNITRIIYSNPFAASWDTVDFALAIDRFSLLEMRPHFPGYPYFIFGGMITHIFIKNPALSLSILTAIMTAFSAIPIYLMARKYFTRVLSLLSVLFVQSFSYLWIISTDPMSEGMAISILWWFFWSVFITLNRPQHMKYRLLPLLLYSLLLGTRLSYFPFGIVLVLLWYLDWKRNNHKKKTFIANQIMLAVGLQFIWIGALIVSEGSIRNFVYLSISFVSGHFSDWGGAVTATSIPLTDRLFMLTWENFIWTGIFGQKIALIVLLACILILTYVTNRRIKFSQEFKILFLMGIAYFLWALIAQNVEKPRHIAPLIPIGGYVLFYVIFQNRKHMKAKVILLTLFIVMQSWTGFQWIKEKATVPPATYQLANKLSSYSKPLFVYTWEETRVLDYLNVSYGHREIYTYSEFLGEIQNRKTEKIYLTNSVIEGFKKQGASLEGKIRKVKTFQSNPLFDPIYYSIVLYEWIG